MSSDSERPDLNDLLAGFPTRPQDSWIDSVNAALACAASPQTAVRGLERLAAVADGRPLLELDAQRLDRLVRILGASPALARYLANCGDDWPQAAAGYDEPPPDASELARRIETRIDDDSMETLQCALREVAAQEFYRIATRDFLRMVPLVESLGGLTRLAEVAFTVATRRLRESLAADGGAPTTEGGRPVGFAVLGLGKLGGRELNFSSDVDVMYLYETDHVDDASPGAREFFTRLASAVTRAVGEPTAHGNVFRVDLRLRPEGNNGPLVNTVDNALQYYEGWGDTWERAALAKARPVGGDAAVGQAFLDGIEPFIYRRHLDYQTVEDMHSMKTRIDAEQALLGAGRRDVKVGRGGIRELEFVVQVLQLIHGGHRPELRVEGSMAGLAVLEDGELIDADEARRLREAYEFLRNTEHAIQVEEKRQTQALPTTHDGRVRLARLLGHTGCDADEAIERFEEQWRLHTELVHDAFVRFFEFRPESGGRSAAERPDVVALLACLREGAIDRATEMLADMGFDDAEGAATGLSRLVVERVRGPVSPQRRRAVEQLAPSLIDAVRRSSDPGAALERLVDFLTHTGAHTSYLALLSGSPATLELLVLLFASSPFLARHLVGRPELLDSLVRADAVAQRLDRDRLAASLEARLPADPSDEELLLEGLRRFRTAELIRIGLDDLSGSLPADEVRDELTALADVCLVRAVDAARALVEPRVEADWERLELAAIGMGKLGAEEMSYGSDLDLIFVYRSTTDGYDAAAHVAATRWVQKSIALLTSQTRDGIVYEVDTRLRPSGRSGPLVISLDRFRAYHAEQAELWERQALLRARVVYGSAALTAEVDRTVAETVYGRGLDDAGVGEIRDLRARVETELADEGAGTWNLKTGRGGIVDVEFLVQMLQLRHGHEYAGVQHRATLPAIAGLADAGILDDDEARRLSDGYRFLRRVEARLRLEWDRPVESLSPDPDALAALAGRLGYGGDRPGAALLAETESVRETVRALFERYFEETAEAPS